MTENDRLLRSGQLSHSTCQTFRRLLSSASRQGAEPACRYQGHTSRLSPHRHDPRRAETAIAHEERTLRDQVQPPLGFGSQSGGPDALVSRSGSLMTIHGGIPVATQSEEGMGANCCAGRRSSDRRSSPRRVALPAEKARRRTDASADSCVSRFFFFLHSAACRPYRAELLFCAVPDSDQHHQHFVGRS